MALHSSKKRSHSLSRQRSKLIDGRNHETRKPPVDRFIHSYDCSHEFPANEHCGLTHLTNRFVGLSGFGSGGRIPCKFRSAPRHSSRELATDSYRCPRTFSCERVRCLDHCRLYRHPIWRCCTTDPKAISNGHSPNLSTSFRRKSSRAHISVAARPS